MKISHTRAFALSIFLSLIIGVISASGSDYTGVTVTQIKKATHASTGQKLEYLRTDKPEVTVLTVEIPAGGDTGWHYHPVPVYAYILSGSITVEIDNGTSYSFREGDAILEVVNTPHIGKNMGKEPVKLVVFYTGIEGSPNTVKVLMKQ